MAYADMYLRFATAGKWSVGERGRKGSAAWPRSIRTWPKRPARAPRRPASGSSTGRPRSAARRALVLNPNLEQARYFAAAAYYHIGYMEEAIIEMEKGRELQGPTSSSRSGIEGLVALFSGASRRRARTSKESSRLSSQAIGDTYLALCVLRDRQRKRADRRYCKHCRRAGRRRQRPGAGAALAGILASQGHGSGRARQARRGPEGRATGIITSPTASGAAYTQLGDLGRGRAMAADPRRTRAFHACRSSTGIRCSNPFGAPRTSRIARLSARARGTRPSPA